MPLFTYSGDDGRYYPELGLTCDDGQTVELDEAPDDGRFTSAGSSQLPPKPTPPVTPATAPIPESE